MVSKGQPVASSDQFKHGGGECSQITANLWWQS